MFECQPARGDFARLGGEPRVHSDDEILACLVDVLAVNVADRAHVDLLGFEKLGHHVAPALPGSDQAELHSIVGDKGTRQKALSLCKIFVK